MSCNVCGLDSRYCEGRHVPEFEAKRNIEIERERCIRIIHRFLHPHDGLTKALVDEIRRG
jgi:hypothetical protein